MGISLTLPGSSIEHIHQLVTLPLLKYWWRNFSRYLTMENPQNNIRHVITSGALLDHTSLPSLPCPLLLIAKESRKGITHQWSSRGTLQPGRMELYRVWGQKSSFSPSHWRANTVQPYPLLQSSGPDVGYGRYSKLFKHWVYGALPIQMIYLPLISSSFTTLLGLSQIPFLPPWPPL